MTAVVPTIGRSPHLVECLQRLRSQGGSELEIVVVAQGGMDPGELEGMADRVDALPENLGFAGGCNHAIEKVEREFVALVNDDLLIEPGWLLELLSSIRADPAVGAVQGLNVQLERPERMDGYGIGWNCFWRPVQLGREALVPESKPPRVEIFGASATAAIYRTRALREAALESGEIFDSRLESYYEDVDLAIRLARKGWRALAIPSARALHSGGASSRDRAGGIERLAISNRLLVSAGLFGRTYWRVLPLLLVRDLADILQHVRHSRFPRMRAVLAGWLRALKLARHYAHAGACSPALPEIKRHRVFRASSAQLG